MDRSPRSPLRTPSSPLLRPRVGSDDLPDLTNKLQELGIYDSYVEWRDSYQQWRKGGTKGSKGENSMQAHVMRKSAFDYWYPTVATFTFRRTISFWAPLATCEGCLYFLWVPFFNEYSIYLNASLNYSLTKIPNLYGGCCFLFGIYLFYFELINVFSDVDNKKLNYLWGDWQLMKNMPYSIFSLIGTTAYLIGALFYTVGQVSEFYDLSESSKSCLVEWPYIIGGVLFFIGGLTELKINQVFFSLPTRYVWWVSVFNAAGGLGFWMAVVPSVVGKHGPIIGVFGVLGYLFAAALQLVMWRGEQFGLALIPALNKVQRQGEGMVVVRTKKKSQGIGHIIPASVVGTSPPDGEQQRRLDEVLNPRLSWRGFLFLTVYVLIAFLQSISCFICLSHIWKIIENVGVFSLMFRRIMHHLVLSICYIIIMHMILVLNSVCVNVPAENPYRTLVLLMRAVCLVLLASSFLNLVTLFEL